MFIAVIQKGIGLLRSAALKLVLCVLVAMPIAATAQGCALCYTQAASSGSRMIRALRNGILILVVPPMFLSLGFTLMAYRRRDSFSQLQEDSQPCFDGEVRSSLAGYDASGETAANA